MKREPVFIFLILLAIFISACAPAGSMPAMAPAPTYVPGNQLEYDTAGVSSSASDGYLQPADVTQLVIRNADLVIVVIDPLASMTAIMDMASQMKGYVVSSKSYKTPGENGNEVSEASIVVRVPAEKLDEALALIRKLTVDPSQDIRSENVTGQDVTSDYVDLQSQLTNLQNTEVQLQRIQDSATKTEDVLAVFNQLTTIRGKIEQIKGQMKYYEESAALSAISVSLLSKAGIAPISIGGWEPVGVVRDAFQSLIDVGKFLVEALIWIVILFLPLGLILYFPGRWIWRFIKRRLPATNKTPAPLSEIPPYPPSPGTPPPQYPDIK